jgi:hypothetical protein
MEFLLSNSFAEYRLAEIRAGAKFFKGILLTKRDPEYFRGVTDMLREIVKLPMVMAQSKEEKQRAELLTETAFKEIEARILRSVILQDD